ncbi:DUF2809 domain-containing protein [uncultured Rhodoblastus sp.]|uniref:ribosomal maturation YjgA family protein n=1 Tax=uncultured Rhodoblastus sp. TaxID=543037 RepID=UPI0025CDEFC3|nr:DUF2809 domain-containing protein [uncultured Rhodoblastus sp.]
MILASLPAKRLLLALAVIAGGAWLRLHGSSHHIPASYIHYGYWALWAALVYFLVALLLRSRPQNQILFVAALVCVLVEVSKLSHTPALDVFRLTPVGAWLLGKVFSYWNFLAYGAGLAAAFGLDALFAGNFIKKSRGRRR